MKPIHSLRFLIAVLLFTLTATPRAQDGAAVPAVSAQLEVPATDDGLPGSGPIRRADWFRNLWKQRRTSWAARIEKDRHSVVLLGDSITQGWGEDFSYWFPGMKIANRGISGDTSRGVLIRLKEDVLAHWRADWKGAATEFFWSGSLFGGRSVNCVWIA